VKRALALLIPVLALAGCGQLHGVHVQFQTQYTEAVATSDTAHGQSAATRKVPVFHSAPLPTPTPIPQGRRILHLQTPAHLVTVTWPQWAGLLLDHVQAPRCVNNLLVVVAWEQQEGTTAGWNPLATTYSMPGSTTYNSAGVRNYPTLEEGLQATVSTLQQGFTSHGYGAIVRDLQACTDPITSAEAINASDWCRGCSGGAYVTGVVERVIAAYVASTHRP
jgi:hypothetical protein